MNTFCYSTNDSAEAFHGLTNEVRTNQYHDQRRNEHKAVPQAPWCKYTNRSQEALGFIVKWSQKSRQVNKVDLDFISGKIFFRERRQIHDGRQTEELFGGV